MSLYATALDIQTSLEDAGFVAELSPAPERAMFAQAIFLILAGPRAQIGALAKALPYGALSGNTLILTQRNFHDVLETLGHRSRTDSGCFNGASTPWRGH